MEDLKICVENFYKTLYLYAKYKTGFDFGILILLTGFVLKYYSKLETTYNFSSSSSLLLHSSFPHFLSCFVSLRCHSFYFTPLLNYFLHLQNARTVHLTKAGISTPFTLTCPISKLPPFQGDALNPRGLEFRTKCFIQNSVTAERTFAHFTQALKT